jgi:CRP-like cAMP-binding protein
MQQQHSWMLDLGKLAPEGGTGPAVLPGGEPPEPPQKANPDRNPAQLLARLPFLRNLNLDQVRMILRSCCVGSYEVGDRICAVDASDDEMFILISGELAVLAKDGSEALTVKPVTTIGALGFITNRPDPIALVAKSRTKVLELSRAKFDEVLRSDPNLQTKVYLNIIDILADSLHNLRNLVEGALATRTPDAEA